MTKEQFLNWSFNIIIALLVLITVLYLGKLWIDKEVKRQVEETRLHFQENRLIAMGELLGNIAHHWKQPLNTISLMAMNIQKQSDKGELTPPYLEEKLLDIEEVIEEMSKTIEEFYSHLTPIKNREMFSINKTIRVAIKILSSLLKKQKIEILFIEQDNYNYNGYKNELLQALLIILTNAKDSLVNNQELKEKKITIKLSKTENKICITVQDNSLGILDENLHRVFDPYFTTAHKTQGKGLGLYIAKMIIIERFNGSISVHNEGGAVFNIILGESRV
jgi:signal transduction histidine kinase